MKYYNECIDCGYVGEDGIWVVEGYEGIIHIREEYDVKVGNDSYFNLDVIDSKSILDKYHISEEKAEELIMNGEPICPKCKSKSFFELTIDDGDDKNE